MTKISALFLNCTLKKSGGPKASHTQKLIDIVSEEMRELGAQTSTIRIVDYVIPFSIHTHAKDEPRDDWPKIHAQIINSDILIIASPIWFGTRASVTQLVMERISGMYEERDPKTGQYPLYNKVAGCIVTGNEDGAHDVIANTLYNLTHMGATVPPNADCY
jgi:multimeric flavodoxin WrbA